MTSIWWQRGVIYQIYPRSFQDSNGDGIGDLAGIERRLDYIQALGVDAIWLSPIFPSPMADFGYDVSDYRGIHPAFGSLDDFDRLLAATHKRGLRLLLDFVPNHSSSEHPWFVESRATRDNPRRDWYLWRDPAADRGPPNNWISDFGGSAWEWDAATGQYYYHAFLKEQPDLNWRNPAVRAEMIDALRFWLARGVDGFRIDVLWHIIKAADFPDNPANPDYRAGMGEMFKVLQQHSTDQPEVHEIAAEMRALADGFETAPGKERVLIGEIYLPVERLMHYYGREAPGVHLPFNFQLIDVAWNATVLADLIAAYEAALPAKAWPNWVLGNHDRPRVAARLGEAQARVAAMLLLTLRGTPTLYYGDELGIGQVEIPAGMVQDPRDLREPGLGLGRDPVRTPMAWDESANAGFSTGAPWLPLHADWPARNVAATREDPFSILSLHRALIALRRSHDALSIGAIERIADDGPALRYERSHGDERILVLLNLSDAPHQIAGKPGRVLLSTLADAPRIVDETVMLRPSEGLVIEIAA